MSSVGINDPVTVFDDTLQVPWEVDDFRAKFKNDVLPKVKSGSKVEIETRLSEAPEVRRGIADNVRAQLTAAGAVDPKVRVLSAYKQGFLWLTEVVIPDLKGKGAKSVNIKIASNDPDTEVRRQAIFWLGNMKIAQANQILENLLRRK